MTFTTSKYVRKMFMMVRRKSKLYIIKFVTIRSRCRNDAGPRCAADRILFNSPRSYIIVIPKNYHTSFTLLRNHISFVIIGNRFEVSSKPDDILSRNLRQYLLIFFSISRRYPVSYSDREILRIVIHSDPLGQNRMVSDDQLLQYIFKCSMINLCDIEHIYDINLFEHVQMKIYFCVSCFFLKIRISQQKSEQCIPHSRNNSQNTQVSIGRRKVGIVIS